MDVTTIAERIVEKIRLLEKGRGRLQTAAMERAKTLAQYECKLAVTLIKLKNGARLSLEGETIEDPPATISERIARGICWQERLAAEQAEAEYKIAVEKLRAVEAELNGYQSIYRHLEEA